MTTPTQPTKDPKEIDRILRTNIYPATLMDAGTVSVSLRGVEEAVEAIRSYVAAESRKARNNTLQEVLEAVADMEAAYTETDRKVSRGEIIKWIQHELGTGEGRHG